MADRVLEKLEEQLKCAVCFETYTDPKQLQCFHVYCVSCLKRLVTKDRQGVFSITCPTCRKPEPVPPTGVSGLQSAFQINHLLEIWDSFKNPTSGDGAMKERSGAAVFAVGCEDHNRELELYCQTCEELVCFKCALKGGRHGDHDYDLLNTAFDKYLRNIPSILERMEEREKSIVEAQRKLGLRCDKIRSQQSSIKANIEGVTYELHQVLDARKTELIDQLEQTTETKLLCLKSQLDQLERSQVQSNSCVQSLKGRLDSNELDSNSKGAVLKMKKTLSELSSHLGPEMLEADTDADIMFINSLDTVMSCRSFGEISAQELMPDPLQCQAAGKGLDGATVGETAYVIMEAFTSKGEPSKRGIEIFESNLVSELNRDSVVRCIVERRGQSQYEIRYKPTVKGRHQLHIKVDDRHISGSPFTVAVKLPLVKLSQPLMTIGDCKKPWGIAINQRSREVILAEYGGHRMTVFNPKGEKLRSFGSHGSDAGKFKLPHGTTVDGDGNFLVVDNHHRVQKFTEEGRFLATVGTKGGGILQFFFPKGIVYNHSNGKVYVVDENNRVQVLNSDFTFSTVFGSLGTGEGFFDHPNGIACDKTGNVYVADTENHRIQVFTATGKFLRVFGRCGQGEGELNRPIGIAVDSDDVVYVSESENHRISVFTSEGQFVTFFGQKGEKWTGFKNPHEVAVDDMGVVYVCDYNNNCVNVF